MGTTRYYLNYNEYKSLGGQLDQTPFILLEFEARKEIDKLTQNRLIDVEDRPVEVKMCMYNLVSKLESYVQNNESTINKNIASESVGSYSVSYVNGNDIQNIIKARRLEVNDIIYTYLTGVVVNNEHLIYLGVK